MKQMGSFPAQIPATGARPAQTDFSIFNGEINSAGQLNSLGSRIRQKTAALLNTLLSRSRLRQLLLTAAATAALTALVLAASYIFFVQLAAYGW
jgi:hypothetical protein